MSNSHLGAEPTSSVQSVDRALAILEILAESGESGVTDIANALGIHKSTASRLLSALLSRDFVEQVADRGRFKLGLGVLRLAGAVTSNLEGVAGSRSITKRLATDVGETVNIAVLRGNQVFYVDQVAGPNILSMRSWVGNTHPTHCSATGKALTAWLPEKERIAARPSSWEKVTPHSITSAKALEAELAKVRDDGYAVANEELEEGLVAIAAPVRDGHDRVIATVSISAPAYRVTKKDFPEIAQKVMAAAKELSIIAQVADWD